MTAITAWRYWRVHLTDDWEWMLAGDRERWEGPLKEAGTHDAGLFSAFARIDAPREAHQSPAPGCLCGINSLRRLRTRDLLSRTGAHFSSLTFSRDRGTAAAAFAQVDLGGKVDEYTEGYRAQHALISGPIYVVNAPPEDRFPDWRSSLERRYGQPVIVQDVGEALDWIRKDEEAHGHRRVHQDARAGASGGPGGTGAGVGTVTVTLGANTGAFRAAIRDAERAAGALARAVGADARARRRARTRMIGWGLAWINAGFGMGIALSPSPEAALINVGGAGWVWWMMLKRRP